MADSLRVHLGIIKVCLSELLFSSQIPQNYDQGKAKAIRHLKALEDGIAMKLCLKKDI